MNKKIVLVGWILALAFIPWKNIQADFWGNVMGKILLEVEKKGEAWYVNPENSKRYFLGRPDDAFAVMRSLGLGISEVDFKKFNNRAPEKLAGRILIRAEHKGEAYYVYPNNLKLYYLGRPADAFKVMRELGLGIGSSNLEKVAKSDSAFNYEEKMVKTVNGNFNIKMVEVDLTKNVAVKTDTADNADCDNNCSVKNLKEYVESNSGEVGIHGSYFCPASYASCGGKTGSYFYPVYQSRTKTLINSDEIKWLEGAILVFDEDNKTYFYPNGPDFVSAEDFVAKTGKQIQALISNGPALIYSGLNIVASRILDEKQRTVKSSRGGIGIKNNKAYLIIASGATVPDLAGIMQALQMETGLNLDGGGSSALYYNGGYKVGPGRDIPNAIVFGEMSERGD